MPSCFLPCIYAYRESCAYYDYNYSLAAKLGYDAVHNDTQLFPIPDTATQTCEKRMFEEHAQTIVSEVIRAL